MLKSGAPSTLSRAAFGARLFRGIIQVKRGLLGYSVCVWRRQTFGRQFAAVSATLSAHVLVSGLHARPVPCTAGPPGLRPAAADHGACSLRDRRGQVPVMRLLLVCFSGEWRPTRIPPGQQTTHSCWAGRRLFARPDGTGSGHGSQPGTSQKVLSLPHPEGILGISVWGATTLGRERTGDLQQQL